MHNLRNVGFLTLKNVEGYDEGEHYLAVKAFFDDIPDAERRKLALKNHNRAHKNFYRGLTPIVGNDPAHKEMYDMGGSMNLVSNESLKHPLYEETPFVPQ